MKKLQLHIPAGTHFTEIIMKERFQNEKAYTLWYYLHKAQSNTVLFFFNLGAVPLVCLLWKFITLYTLSIFYLSIFCIYMSTKYLHKNSHSLKMLHHSNNGEWVDILCGVRIMWSADCDWPISGHSSLAHKKDKVVEITEGNFWEVLG